jgi:hypothetical protein
MPKTINTIDTLTEGAKPYYTTLKRIPSEILLSMATRDFKMEHPNTCIVGWALREHFIKYVNPERRVESVGIVETAPHTTQEKRIVELFGGTCHDWNQIFFGVCSSYKLPLIEEAFVACLDDAVNGG